MTAWHLLCGWWVDPVDLETALSMINVAISPEQSVCSERQGGLIRKRRGNWAQDSPTEAAVYQQMQESMRKIHVGVVGIFNKSVSKYSIWNDNFSFVAVEGLVLLCGRYRIFLFFSSSQQTQEHKLKISTHWDLRSITLADRFYLFSPTQKHVTKCILHWKAEQKKAFLVRHYLRSITRQYLLAVTLTTLAPPCFHCAPVTVHLEHTNAFCILSPHRTQNNTHANSSY